MESSCIKCKWVNSLDYSPLKHIKMNEREKLNKITESSSIIFDLKSNTKIDSKKTIQKLQQQIDTLIYEKRNNN